MEELTHFSEDAVISAAAESLGLRIERRVRIEVTSEPALKRAGLMRESPDYPRIRKLLEDEALVEGAALGQVEFVLRRPKGPK